MSIQSEIISLKELVEISGKALEAEDRYILGCSLVNGMNGGILRLPNERYYQFITCRAWLSKWNVVAEEKLHDAVIKIDDANKVIVEMKDCRSEKGNTEEEIEGIKEDIKKLKSSDCQTAIMLIFSNDEPPKEHKRYMEEFLEKCPELAPYDKKGLEPHERKGEEYVFPTFSVKGNEANFWVAGWRIK